MQEEHLATSGREGVLRMRICTKFCFIAFLVFFLALLPSPSAGSASHKSPDPTIEPYYPFASSFAYSSDDDDEKEAKKKKKKEKESKEGKSDASELMAEMNSGGVGGKSGAKKREAKEAFGANLNMVTGSMLSEDEMDEIVAIHARLRAKAGVDPLVWSPQIAAYAQQWADQLAKKACEIAHRPNSGKWKQLFGENIFQGAEGVHSAKDAVLLWAEEKSLYEGGKFDASMMPAAHYTQIVWRKTTQFGCAKSYCGRSVIYVCNYDPVGNIIGQRPY